MNRADRERSLYSLLEFVVWMGGERGGGSDRM